MKIAALIIGLLCLLLGCSNKQAPEGMFPIKAKLEVLKEEKKEVPDYTNETIEIIQVQAVKVRFLEPKEFQGIEYSIHLLPSEKKSIIFSDSVGKQYSCTIIKLALLNGRREFNSAALSNIEPIDRNGSNQPVESTPSSAPRHSP